GISWPQEENGVTSCFVRRHHKPNPSPAASGRPTAPASRRRSRAGRSPAGSRSGRFPARRGRRPAAGPARGPTGPKSTPARPRPGLGRARREPSRNRGDRSWLTQPLHFGPQRRLGRDAVVAGRNVPVLEDQQGGDRGNVVVAGELRVG